MINNKPIQNEMEFISIDLLVPEDHILRKISKHIDFSFINERTKHLYSATRGRPAIPPVVLFKAIFIGYLFGIRSERELVRQIQVNIAYRWFLGYKLTDKIFDDSTLSQNRRRRFNASTIYQEIFDEIVHLAISKNLVTGETLYTDSTHLRANANNNKYTKEVVSETTRAYIKGLEEAIEEARKERWKKPFDKDENKPSKTKEIRKSKIDPDSGYMRRERKPEGFYYLDHRTTDGKYAIITDTTVTSGNVHDSVPYLSILDNQISRYGFKVKEVGLDSGYNSIIIHKGLEDRNILGITGRKSQRRAKELLLRKEYKYDKRRDVYICPKGEELKLSTIDRNGHKIYKSKSTVCAQCDKLGVCTKNKKCEKVINRHIFDEVNERAELNRRSQRGREIYKRRKETVERSFADAKQLHGHRYAKFRGLAKVAMQCLLCAAVQNMKKISLILDKRGDKGRKNGLFFVQKSQLDFGFGSICNICVL